MPTAPGQKQARGQARRQQILDAALEAFAADGYRPTSLAKIAARVGISEPGLIYHFPTKAELLAEVLRHRDNVDPSVIARIPADNILDAIRRMATLADILIEHPWLMRFDAVVGGESIAEAGQPYAHFQARLRNARHATSIRLREAAQAGTIRDDIDPDAIAAEVIAFMDGIQTQWLFDPDTIDLRASYRHFFDGLAERLTPTHARRKR